MTMQPRHDDFRINGRQQPDWPRIPAPQQRINDADIIREQIDQTGRKALQVMRQALIVGVVLLAAAIIARAVLVTAVSASVTAAQAETMARW